MMRVEFGFKSAPRGLVYLHQAIFNGLNWKQQKLLLELAVRTLASFSLSSGFQI
ncbi:hypothetical protein BGZ61DRAFT_455222 [Ilyonectria robusta]|uniref:uncharacterized protein n=1 Tax=Ilyonectria robusta TaxID=1079257 RepID=UPI001E8E3A13|nr:uncharacterized protein BGZ61DRAFT_455222 [Ilyonectria robusta]KAH8685281.1 hypothetical protein BGZ61DRAFT_455222 [Ilyonectria robusta]